MAFAIKMHTLKQIADAIGMGDKPVTAITIEARVAQLTKVKVEMLLDVPGHDGLCKVLKEYHLMPVEPKLSPGLQAIVDNAHLLGKALEDNVERAEAIRDKQTSDGPASEPVKFREWT